MLSQKEVEFLQEPNRFDSEYSKVLRHRIRSKVGSLREEILLLERAGFKVMKNCNIVTDFRNSEISTNRAALSKTKWTGGI